jgi:enoyl-CoA hydratase/carnithine racemase
MMDVRDEILFSERHGKHGSIGLILLNRPTALNALTQAMCVAMNQQLQAWAKDAHIKCVVVQSNNDKAFCAGGDIRRIYDLGKAGDYKTAQQFFADEYRNNYTIHNYPKPYIALMDGITMGGGVGISLHGSHKVVTERTLFAMPETGIGFFPDVGGSYFLSRCDDEFGTYLALTGARLTAASLIDAGLADHVIMSHHLEEMLVKLAAKDFGHDSFFAVTEVLNEFSAVMEPSSDLRIHRSIIGLCFSHDDIPSIFQCLSAHNSQWSNEVLALLLTKSPMSLSVALEQLRRGVSLDLANCLKMEYCLGQHFLKGHDFYEGVRAQLVDKDKNPRWQPSKIEDISSKSIADYFETTKETEFQLETLPL